MKNVLKIALIAFSLFLLVACHDSQEDTDSVESPDVMSRVSQQEKRMTVEQTAEDSPAEYSSAEYIASEERRVAYTAHVDIVVAKFSEAEEEIKASVRKEGGYVLSSNIQRDERNNQRGHLTVKVPTETFDSFLKRVEEISVEVNEQSIQGEDVTEEYIDLEARLNTKREVKKKLEQFLEEATKTEDLLNITKQIGDVQAEIEQLEGRLNVLTNQTDLATITISMTERIQSFGEVGANEQKIWSRAKQLFVSTLNAIVTYASSTIVIIVGLSPIFLPIIAVVIGVFIYRKRKRKKAASRES